jgi:co-chaperonin GroES (HSP10)
MKKEAKPKIHPQQDYCLIRRDPAEKVSEGGIIMVAPIDKFAGRVELRWGTVVAVGPGRWSRDGKERLPCFVRPGDRIGFPPVFQGIEHKRGISSPLEAEEIMLRASDIWAMEERA